MSRAKPRQNKYERYSHISLGLVSAVFFIVITAVFPLYISRLSYNFMTMQKSRFFVIAAAVGGIAAFVALILTTRRLRPENYFAQGEPKRPVTVYEWAFLAFIALAFVSAAVSPWQDFVWRGYTSNGLSGRWEGFWVYLCYFITFAVISRFHRPSRLHFLIFAASAALVSLYGILQYLGADVLEIWGFMYFKSGQDPITATHRTTLGNNNIVAAYSSLAAVLFAGLYAGEESRWRFVYLVSASMSFALLCITRDGGDAGRLGMLGGMALTAPFWISDRKRFGRILAAMSCWCVVFGLLEAHITLAGHPAGLRYPLPLFFVLGAVLGLLGACLIFALKKWPSARFMKIAGAVFLAAALAGGLLFVEIEGRRREGRPNDIIFQAREAMRGRLDDSFGSWRPLVWRLGLSVIPENPLLGTGPDTFFFALGGELEDPPVQPTQENPYPYLIRLGGLHLESVEITGSENKFFDKAHNIFLQIAVCMGIPALIAFLVFLGGIFSDSLKKASQSPVLLAFTAASLCYLIQAFFQIDSPIDRPLFYAVLGVMSGEAWRVRIKSV